MLEPLTPVKNELTILDGIDFKGVANHDRGMQYMLTASEFETSPTQGASVDQYIASSVGQNTRFSSLELGVQTSAFGGNVQTRMSYSRAGVFVPPNDDPRDVHRRLFGDERTSSEALYARRLSVLDVLRSEIRDVSSRLDGAEKAKLDAHLSALRQVENGFGAPPPGCPSPGPVLALDPHENDNFGAVGRAQTDLLVTALACDMTRVASLQWSHTVSPTVFSWLGLSLGHHELSHIEDSNAAGVADFIATERWFAEQFRYLVDRLAALPEPGGDGRMLDHSIVVWCKELGDGRLHDCISVPFVIAGGGGGLVPGRYLRYDAEPHTKLLVSLCRAMGVDIDVFGTADHGTGPLEGLFA